MNAGSDNLDWKLRRRNRICSPRVSAQYEAWEEQLDSYAASAIRFPWQIVPLYHYDPRRYQNDPSGPFRLLVYASGLGTLDKQQELRDALRDEFQNGANTGDEIKAGGDGIAWPFIGFKMYPPLGYRPCDFTRLPGLKGYYATCERIGIPIVAHCNPTGFPIDERHLFLTYDTHGTHERGFVPHEESNAAVSGRGYTYTSKFYFAKTRRKNYVRASVRYFSDEYISPEGWAKVLVRYPDLRLNLAHFGSNETPTGDIVKRVQGLRQVKSDIADVDESLKQYESTEKDGGLSPGEKRRKRRLERLKSRLQRREKYREKKLQDDMDEKRSIEIYRNLILPPPNSGWEYAITENLRNAYFRDFRLDEDAIDVWMKFPLWNRQILALICTHEHVYTDISYFFLNDKTFDRARPDPGRKNESRFGTFYESFSQAMCMCAKLRRRVLFGTDWYMATQHVYGFGEYYTDTERIFEKLERDLKFSGRMFDEPEIRTMVSVINPARFYRLGELRETYTKLLIEQFGAKATKTQEADAAIADMCSRAKNIDPEYIGSDTYRDPCKKCEKWDGSRCRLVREMGFKVDGTYDYERAQPPKLSPAGVTTTGYRMV